MRRRAGGEQPRPPGGGAGRGPDDGIRVRRMRWWDLPAVLAVERELFAPDAWTVNMFLSELADWRGRWYVVLLDTSDVRPRLVGYAGLQTYAGEAYLNTIAVAPSHQGRGLGARLLDLLVAQAEARGATLMGLEVAAGNLRAQQLYASRGFEAIAVRSGYYAATGEDAVVMARRLGGRDGAGSGTMAV